MKLFAWRRAQVLLVIACSSSAWGQLQRSAEELPDSPGAVLQAAVVNTQAADNTRVVTGTATVDGVVQDTQGDPVPEAQVILTTPGKPGERTVIADSTGAFHFAELPPAEYRLIVSARGMAPYTSAEFAVKAGQTFEVPKVALLVGATSSVDVVASQDQIAEAQIHEQEKQRVFGVFPNFYTSYIWDAAPMTTKQKYGLVLRTLADPVNLLGTAAAAGAQQATGTYAGYGPGIGGYGKRYAAAFGDVLTGRLLGGAVFPSVFHQDPRYFYQGSGGKRSRTLHALSWTFLCRGDSGRDQPNYSYLFGSLAAGGLANAYHPAADRGVGLTFQTFGIGVGGDMVGNLFREFVVRRFVSSVPSYAIGKP